MSGVSASYGSHRVLTDISLSVTSGDPTGLIGENGSGKSTLLRLILLSVRPTRGLVSVFGEEVSGISAKALTGLRRRMGVVFQDFRLLDHLTTYENVALPLELSGFAGREAEARSMAVLERVGLAHRARGVGIAAGQDQGQLLAAPGQAAALLAGRGIESCADLVAAAHDDDLRRAWCVLPGQSSGSTWRHLLLAAGCDDVMLCPLTRSFARRATGHTFTADELHAG